MPLTFSVSVERMRRALELVPAIELHRQLAAIAADEAYSAKRKLVRSTCSVSADAALPPVPPRLISTSAPVALVRATCASWPDPSDSLTIGAALVPPIDSVRVSFKVVYDRIRRHQQSWLNRFQTKSQASGALTHRLRGRRFLRQLQFSTAIETAQERVPRKKLLAEICLERRPIFI